MLTKARTSLLIAALVASTAQARTDSLLTLIDFEGLAEGTPISTQYSTLGVTFSIEGNPALSPLIAVEGGAGPVAFVGPEAFDTPMPDGIAGLTDPNVGGDYGVPNDIRIDFSPPVTSVRFYLIDLDGTPPDEEHATISAFDGGGVVQFITLAGAPENDGAALEVVLTGNSISSVLIDVSPRPSTGLIGWAIDSLTFARPCANPGCTPRFRISQESAPGIGDYASNILGELPLWVAEENSAAQLYAYDSPNPHSWNGSLIPLEPETSHLVGAVTTDGISLFVLHEMAVSHTGAGEAEMQIEVINDADDAAFVVYDDPTELDPNDIYTSSPVTSVFTAKNDWETCCTDGFVLGDIACTSALIIQFTDVDGNPATPTINGLSQWMSHGSDGSQLFMALVENRRVRIDVLPRADCPADLDCDSVVGATDLAILLGAWGPTTVAADIDGSGAVDAVDLAILLGAWGPCGGP